MQSKIFISYSSIDKEIADKLALQLDYIGMNYFLDRKDINWGDKITDEIEKGLNKSSAVIIIISPASLKSHWVPYEVGYAKSKGKMILPYLTHPSLDVPGYLREYSYKTDLGSIEAYLKEIFEPKKEEGNSGKKKISPKERDRIRGERNEILKLELEQKKGINSCSIFQLEDHSDKGYLLSVNYKENETSAAEVLSIIRETLDNLFPDIPYWGELLTESDNRVGFGFSYIDEYNKFLK